MLEPLLSIHGPWNVCLTLCEYRAKNSGPWAINREIYFGGVGTSCSIDRNSIVLVWFGGYADTNVLTGVYTPSARVGLARLAKDSQSVRHTLQGSRM